MSTTTERFVGEIMTRNVVSVMEDADLTDAIRTMAQESLSALPVVDRTGMVRGILSSSDLISLIYEIESDVAILPHVSDVARQTLIDRLADKSLTVSSAMTDNVESVKPQDQLGKAARLLTENSIHHLPVVDMSGKPIGILSTSDIVRSVAYPT